VPMRRPGGAVTARDESRPPASSYCFFTYSAAVSSALPPISPIIMTASVSGSLLNNSSASVKFVPIIGSPPIRWPSIARSAGRQLVYRLISQRARPRHDSD
jgi:hypothetical protein